jgi:transcriptional regulator with XRE-family HTH domain
MSIGQEIRRLREARGWSQAKLAGGADMGVSGISQIETGARNPSAVTLAKIAAALEVEVADLFPKEQAPLPLNPLGAEEYAVFVQAEFERVLDGGKPGAQSVPLRGGKEPDVVTLKLHYARLLEENDRLLQEVTHLRGQLEKAGRSA